MTITINLVINYIGQLSTVSSPFISTISDSPTFCQVMQTIIKVKTSLSLLTRGNENKYFVHWEKETVQIFYRRFVRPCQIELNQERSKEHMKGIEERFDEGDW